MLNITTIDGRTLEALRRNAERQSADGCTVHINARVRMFTYSTEPRFEVSFHVSDWYDSDATIESWTNGKRRD